MKVPGAPASTESSGRLEARAPAAPIDAIVCAKVHLGKVDGKSRITTIELTTEAQVPGISVEQFQQIAEGTKSGCPVSAALAGVEIKLQAFLV